MDISVRLRLADEIRRVSEVMLMPPVKTVPLRLDPELYQLASKVADMLGVKRSQLYRYCIYLFINKYPDYIVTAYPSKYVSRDMYMTMLRISREIYDDIKSRYGSFNAVANWSIKIVASSILNGDVPNVDAVQKRDESTGVKIIKVLG